MARRRTIAGLSVMVAVIGLSWLVFHRALAGFLAARMGDRLLRVADGKFTDPRRFVEMRLTDLAVLAAGICILALAHLAVVAGVNRKVSSRYGWVAGAISGFVCLNVFALLASHTALFWCALYSGKAHTHNYTQYEIKSLLMKEIDAPAEAVLVGNSQTHAEMDPALLNERLGKRLWTTELHFPGSRPYDVELSYAKLFATHLKFVICYITEGYFFSGTDSEGLIYFQDWRDVPEYYRLGGSKISMGKHFCYGLLGDTAPLFRLREPLTARLFGFHLLSLPQERYNGGLSIDLAQRAAEAARSYHAGADAEFEKEGLIAFAKTCRERGARLILCVGQMNPVFARALDPAMRRDMISFLDELGKEDDNIILLNESELPKQGEDDYDDLTHVNPPARARFSAYMAGVLDKLIDSRSLADK